VSGKRFLDNSNVQVDFENSDFRQRGKPGEGAEDVDRFLDDGW
jgi:hypothetical protein